MNDGHSIDIVGFIGLLRRLFDVEHVFVRELVQNALEAINQATKLTGCVGVVSIESRLDEGVVTVSDDGVGMTADELLDELTVLFRSGWPSEADATLGIGQFGFGFYSVFLAADEVSVVSRSRHSPERAHRLTLSASMQAPQLEAINGSMPPLGTAVTLPLRAACRTLFRR